MKTLNTFNRFTFVYLFALLCASFLYGCSEAEIPAQINGSWKFIGFVDEKSNKVELVDQKILPCTNCYVITLKEDYKIEGYTRANYVMGSYQLIDDKKKMTIDNFGLMTYAGETEDGTRFIDAMKKVNAYAISSKGLALHYDKDKYLHFEALDSSIVKRNPLMPDN